MQRTPWVDRKFKLASPEGWIYNIISRLEGTIPRLTDLVSDISDEDAGTRPSNNKWSIKEHIGHLYDLEFLHLERLQQLKDRELVLSAADMTNSRTDSADHNKESCTVLLGKFARERRRFVEGLNSVEDDIAYYKALHPRLNIYMRPVDLAEFTAEHDDHHLCTIGIIKKSLGG